MKAFILAGGFATRLWPLTEKRAKPLLPLAGKPIITHLVEKIPVGIPVTVSTNAVFAEGFTEWKRSLGRSNVEIIVEDTKKDDHKLGALGATAKWIEERKITDDLLLLTGDNYLGFSMEDFLKSARPGVPLLAAYDIQDRAKASAFGTVIVVPPLPSGEGGRGERAGATHTRPIAAFEEKPSQAKTSLVSTGCSLLPASTLPVLLSFAKIHPDNVGGVFEEFLRKGIPVDCFTFTEAWLDIGSFPSYLEAHRLLVGETPMIAPTSTVTSTKFQGSISIGARTEVSQSDLTDCMIFEDCLVNDCVLRNCIIDRGCTLRGVDLTGKMLRAGTTLIAPERST